jgi:general secretion pathway protein G
MREIRHRHPPACPARSRRRKRGKTGDDGLTLIELLVVIAIVGILATAVMPLSRMTVRRVKETELRTALRTIRTAIDAFNRDCLSTDPKRKLSSDYCSSDRDNFPESLELLTEPLSLSGAVDKKRKYLRRIPRDPMMPLESPDDTNNWGLRSYSDPPDSTSWGGDDVYDVYSQSDAEALDGSKYSTW